jgi:hypothetical protein
MILTSPHANTHERNRILMNIYIYIEREREREVTSSTN